MTKQPLSIDDSASCEKYRAFVHDLIYIRMRAITLWGGLMFMGFHFVEKSIHPTYPSALFFKVRIALCLFFAITIFANRKPESRKHIIWWCDALIFSAAAAMCFMVYAADGSSGSYYQGLYALFWTLFIGNSYYPRHNAFVGVLILAAYSLAALFSVNQTAWNLNNFSYALFLLSVSAFFTTLMTKYYSAEHRRSFMRNEELQKNQSLLGEANRKLSILYNETKEMSKIDSLTKIYNRGHFLEVLSEKIKICREKNTFFYLVIFDVDHFKDINDKYGHTFGDEVIFKVAQSVDDQLRPQSFIGRYGGDEFMFIIDHASIEALMARLEAIQKVVLNLPLSFNGEKVTISASFGVAKIDPRKESDVTRVIQMADDALLEVKRTCRGQIRIIE